ncbi:hypothetical protein H1164_08485 [Thermoactinomyces daqus]|uniref:Uncharacterized protein n=1 Tax=Thermoactinomyces daqus TaxID=1329516 RepID=A0A7W2AIJ1_9BACL|nr:hypothetical protein [Thermoactinomyces daqus]MBA4542938.1 hypothetical protein [Thermoactinomyces daqus]
MEKDFLQKFLEEQLKNPEFKKVWEEGKEEFQQLKKQVEKKIEEQRPTVEQVAWVFQKLNEHLQEGGTFRYLIYDRMGFDEGDYWLLYSAGGMNISNAIFDSLIPDK